MTEDSAADAHAAFACAALLEQGAKLHLLSLALTLGALLALPLVGMELPWLILCVALVCLGMIEFYVAIRVGLDARLMHRLAEDAKRAPPDLDAFDRGLALAGLRGATATPRSLAERIAGAFGLLRGQAIVTALQIALALVGAVIANAFGG